jgi:hypothetical protein
MKRELNEFQILFKLRDLCDLGGKRSQEKVREGEDTIHPSRPPRRIRPVADETRTLRAIVESMSRSWVVWFTPRVRNPPLRYSANCNVKGL